MPKLRSFTLAFLIFACTNLSGASVRLTLELDRQLYREAVQNNLYLKATIEVEGDPSAPTPRSDIVFLVDRSGSMEGEKLEQTKRAINHGLSLLSSNDTASVIAFGSSVETLIPKTPIDQLGGYASAIENLQSEGGSSLHEGIETAFEALRRNNSDTAIRRTILITDGPPNKGPREAAAFALLYSQLDEVPIAFETLYLATDSSEEDQQALLKVLPAQPTIVSEPSSLPWSVANSLNTDAKIVGKEAALEIEFVSGIEIEESIGQQADISGRTIRFSIGNLRENQELTAIAQATLSASKALYSRTKIAAATLSYTPARTSASDRITLSQEIDAAFTPNSSASFESINTHVYQAVSEGEVADTLAESRQWVSEGREKKAIRELKKLSRNLLSVARDLPELEIDASINQLNTAIQQIETELDSTIERAAQVETLYPSASSISKE